MKKPNIVSKKLKSTFLIPDLSGMLQVFKGKKSKGEGFGCGILVVLGKIGERMLFLDEDQREDVDFIRRGRTPEGVIRLKGEQSRCLLHHLVHEFIASQSCPPYPHSGEKTGISVYSFASNDIIEIFVISELTEVQCYWGKKELQFVLITVF